MGGRGGWVSGWAVRAGRVVRVSVGWCRGWGWMVGGEMVWGGEEWECGVRATFSPRRTRNFPR